MLKQLPSRNQRSKGFKVKHFLQICLLIAICFWLFNHLKHSYGAKKASLEDNSAGELSENLGVEGVVKLGRKHLHPRVNEETSLGIKEGEIKSEDAEDDGHERDGGEDEEESEEVEDLIDVDDRDKDVNEEQDNEDKGNQLGDQDNEDKGKNVATVRPEFKTASR